MTISDPRRAEQWHLALLGGMEAVWTDYAGRGVSVGIYDDGMDTGHEDLVRNADLTLRFPGDDGRHDTPWDGHGTAVAGLIGAALNGLGGVGVAWGAGLTPVDYLGSIQAQSFAAQLAALRHAAVFDVVNQSYGTTPDYDPDGDIGDSGSWAWSEAQAMLEVVRTGRGGLGTVLVKAAGNDADDAFLAAQGITGNVSGEGHAGLHTVMAVAALGRDGRVMAYSSYGAGLWIAAPAGSVTTDVTGTAGYASGSYTTSFGGTSAAAPVVSGVVALMLEANPGLGYRDVQGILALSAAQTGSAWGGPATGAEKGAWQALGGSTWNGGALTWSPSYGYGAVDALAAVRMAEGWSLWQGAARTEQTLIRQSYAAWPQAAITTGVPAEARITVSGGVVIEHAYVTIDMSHARVSDLEIALVTPTGAVLDLLDHEQADALAGGDWTFGVAGLAGMLSTGIWTVRVRDTVAGATGTLRSATLDLMGSPPSLDDVWTVTRDFRALALVDPARAVLSDANGGTDWLNAVALTGNVTLTLGNTGGNTGGNPAGSATTDGQLRVGGTHWATLTGDAIENAATGDGHDWLTGNAGANHLDAGRGRNVVIGGGGADVLTGRGQAAVLVGEARGLYGSAASDQVFRLFHAVFERAPGLDGHLGFAAQVAAGTLSLAQLAGNLTNSAEFRGRYGNTSDEAFMRLLFHNVFGRDPAPEGLANWVAQLEGGRTRGAVVALFSESAEHVALTARGLAAFDAHDATEWTGTVYRLFGAALGREPGPQGMLDWIASLAGGAALRDVVTTVMGSPEYQARYGGTSDTGFVTALFRNVLGRDPAQAGLDAWTGALAAGMSRAEAVERFMQTAENVARTAPALADFMRGFGADDVLRADAPQALLSGGLFSDTFVFHPQAGPVVQVVTDLEPWDLLRFEGFGYADAQEALTHFTRDGADVIFDDMGLLARFLDTGLAQIGADQVLVA